MNKNKQRRREEQQLNEQFQNAHLDFQNDPSEENLVTLNVLKEKMDKMYGEEVEAIIVRSSQDAMNKEKRILGTFLT